MPVISVWLVTFPDTGIGWCRRMPCSPWTSIAQLKSPRLDNPPPMVVSTTAIVGSTCWSMSMEFSVTNGSSSVPAPTPRA